MTARVASHFLKHFNSLCTDCYFEDVPNADLPYTIGSCGPANTLRIARYQVGVRMRIRLFASQHICKVISDIKERFDRDLRSAQAVVDKFGVFEVATVCAECHGSRSQQMSCLERGPPGWHIINRNRSREATICPNVGWRSCHCRYQDARKHWWHGHLCITCWEYHQIATLSVDDYSPKLDIFTTWS